MGYETSIFYIDHGQLHQETQSEEDSPYEKFKHGKCLLAGSDYVEIPEIEAYHIQMH